MKLRHPWALAGHEMANAPTADLLQTIAEDSSTVAYLLAYGRALGLEEAARFVEETREYGSGYTAEQIRALGAKEMEPMPAKGSKEGT